MDAITVHRISVAQDFSRFPAGRYPEDGSFNGTTFRKDVLVPELSKLCEPDTLEVSEEQDSHQHSR